MSKKSTINKRISRKLNTAPFETLDVACEYTEEIEWDSMDERKMKSEKITKLLILDFQRTLHHVMKELELQRQGAVGKRSNE